MEKYEKGQKIGEGAYGVVYKAKRKSDGRVVAIKKIRLQKVSEGVSVVALREIKILQEIRHPNVIELCDVFQHHSNINLVLEFCGCGDLEKIINAKTEVILTSSDVKAYLAMLLEGIAFLHANWVLHRDLKPGNLLITGEGQLKITDFGLARLYGSPDRKFSPQAVTAWYRGPELLYGATSYSTKVDIWSVGCIFAELMQRTALFPGNSDMDQLHKIFSLMGTPNTQNWPNVEHLPDYVPYDARAPTEFGTRFVGFGRDAVDLLSKILVLCPNQRIEAAQALGHVYFVNQPAASTPAQLVKGGAGASPMSETTVMGQPNFDDVQDTPTRIAPSGPSGDSLRKRKLNMEMHVT